MQDKKWEKLSGKRQWFDMAYEDAAI